MMKVAPTLCGAASMAEKQSNMEDDVSNGVAKEGAARESTDW